MTSANLRKGDPVWYYNALFDVETGHVDTVHPNGIVSLWRDGSGYKHFRREYLKRAVESFGGPVPLIVENPVISW